MSILTKGMIANSVIVSAVETKDIVNRAIKIHNLSPVGACAMGRTLTMALLMGKEFKDKKDYLTVIIDGDGPLGKITVCADGDGHVKGDIENPVAETVVKENGHLDVGSAVGRNGTLTVIKDIGLKQPYVGTSPLVSGEIANDFAYYFANSEQQPCGVTLGVGLDKKRCRSAGGVFVQVLPNCPEDLLGRIETVMYAMDEMSYQFDHSTAEDVIKRFFGEFDLVITEHSEVSYKCNCNKRKIDRVVRSLGREEANAIIAEQGQIEVCCHFCGKKYTYDQQATDKLFDK